MTLLSVIGGGWGMLGIVPWLAWSRTRRTTGVLIATLLVTTLVVFIIKPIVHRARPYACLPNVHALCVAPTDPSFPSGHAAGSFAFAAFMAACLLDTKMNYKTKVGLVILVFVFAVGVAMSRVFLGVHFPTDVIAGGIVGGAIGWSGGRIAMRVKAPQ